MNLNYIQTEDVKDLPYELTTTHSEEVTYELKNLIPEKTWEMDCGCLVRRDGTVVTLPGTERVKQYADEV